MSKHMQLTVRIKPYYKNGLQGIYPHIANGLCRLDESWASSSLFDIVESLDKLLYDLEGDPPFRGILLKHQTELRSLQKEIETHVADWKLAEADKLLYRIEDIFSDIEWELDKA